MKDKEMNVALVEAVLGTTFTNYDPANDGITAKLTGTPDAIKLEVIQVGPPNTGNLGRYLAAGKTYTVKPIPWLMFEDMLNFRIPDDECEPTKGSCDVLLAIEQFDDKVLISMELDS